jgi:hypothetical protein
MDSDEHNKWRNALDAMSYRGFERGLQLARKCHHPDAEWFSSFFPAGVPVTDEDVVDAMREQGNDPRALFLFGMAQGRIFNERDERARTEEIDSPSNELLFRAADMGYAPAQADASLACTGSLQKLEQGYRWAKSSAALGDHRGMAMLAQYLSLGRGCDRDKVAAMDLYEKAARLGDSSAQYTYGRKGFG